jgi:hypothetical protein
MLTYDNVRISQSKKGKNDINFVQFRPHFSAVAFAGSDKVRHIEGFRQNISSIDYIPI